MTSYVASHVAVMKTPPDRIWLQRATEDYRDGWTWCWHPIDEGEDGDVEYALARLEVDGFDELCGLINKGYIEEAASKARSLAALVFHGGEVE